MRRIFPFSDVKTADNWLTNFLLNRQRVFTDRLLHTTKLCDLIYRSLDIDEARNKENSPVNSDTLCADLFTALFSPVIRKKDIGSVYFRERALNQPILDDILSDDRFVQLKRLCEDKELISYEATRAFGTAFNRAFDNKPYAPKKDYLAIMDMLAAQVDKSLVILSDASISDSKKVRIYKSVYRKLCQIENLKRKAKEDALCYLKSIKDDISDALDMALEVAAETNCIMTAWGTDAGDGGNIKANRDLLEHVKSSGELLKIAQSLGKYKEMILNKRKNGFSYGRGEKYDLTEGNDFTNCLTSELALLGAPESEILFLRKYEQKRLMQYRKRTAVIKGRGDMIVLLDESGSTRGLQAWAKAFALALLEIAQKDKRKFALVHFASKSEIKTDLFEPGKYNSNDVMRAAEHFFDGGTDFETPLNEAKNLMENGYEKADITIITDGECGISNDFADAFKRAMRQYNASVTGILLDKGKPCGKALMQFCDKVYHSKDITEDEIALEVLNRKVS